MLVNCAVHGVDEGGVSQCTFSSPKNLSLPFSRTGPAFCSSFSRGVNSGGGSSFSFFLLAEAMPEEPDVPYEWMGVSIFLR